MPVTDEIKARLDIVELVSETVKLRRTGKNYTGFCPFHPNSRTPAFVVFPDSGTWRCFGQCNEGGDIFKFVMKKEGWDFPTTLKYLAQKAGVVLEPPTPEKQAEEEEHARLRALLEEAVNFYRHHLLNTAPGKEALAFLQRRGLQPAIIEAFGLGYAPDSYTAAHQHFTSRGYSQQELIAAGLVTERQGEQGVYDRFRHRVMIPIRNMAGHMAGFGARILRPDDVPKFLNSPQTPLFDKGRLLYGLDQARKPIRAQDQVVIVEGYLDVIVLHQAGFTNTVSPMGTALTEDQLRLLKRFTRRIVLALDADAAGEKATLRGLELARQAMDRSDELVFDARGLIRHEARLQADVRVTTLPAGMDPDEVVLRDALEWRKIIDSAQPVVIHVMDTLARSRNVDDPKTKSEIAAQVLPLIEDVPNAVEREDYRQRLARLLRIDERALVGSGAGRAGVPARLRSRQIRGEGAVGPASKAPVVLASNKAYDLEANCLRLLLRQPDLLYLLDRSLQHAGLSRLSQQDFESTDHQLLARLIFQSLEQEDFDPLNYIQQNAAGSLQGLVENLLKPFEKGEPTPEKLREELVRTVLHLRELRIHKEIEQIRFMQIDLQEQGDTGLTPYSELIMQYNQSLQKLQQTLASPLIFE
jgi:DNA primase